MLAGFELVSTQRHCPGFEISVSMLPTIVLKRQGVLLIYSITMMESVQNLIWPMGDSSSQEMSSNSRQEATAPHNYNRKLP